MNIDFKILTLAFLLIVLLVVVRYFSRQNSRKKRRHRKNIQTTFTLLEKFQSFPPESRGPKILAYLRKIDPYVFEELLLTAFQNKGFKIQRGMRYSGDGGVDGQVSKDDINYLIQAKRYRGYVNKDHVKQFILLVNQRKSPGLFIHTGRTGKGVRELVYGTNVQIISGSKLIQLLGLD